jgi:hypothetical protein
VCHDVVNLGIEKKKEKYGNAGFCVYFVFFLLDEIVIGMQKVFRVQHL